MWLPIAPGARGAAIEADGVRFEYVSQVGGASYSVVADGNRAYLSAGPRVLVVDLVAPGSPTVIAQSEPVPGVIRAMAIDGDSVYAGYTAGESWECRGGVAVVSVADPNRPRVVGTADVELAVRDVAVTRSHAYLVGSGELQPFSPFPTGMLAVVDVAAPSAPQQVAEIGFWNEVTAVAAEAQNLYVLEARFDQVETTVVRAIDVTSPASPAKVSVVAVPGAPNDIVAAGGRLYLAGGRSGLRVLDASPDRMSELGFTDIRPGDTCADALAVSGHEVAVADTCSRSVHLVNVSDSRRPGLLGSVPLSAVPAGLAARQDRVVVASGLAGGLAVLDATPARYPALVAELHTLGAAQRIGVGERIYALHRDYGVTISAPNPGGVGRVDAAAGAGLEATLVPLLDATDLVLSGSHLYVGEARSRALHAFQLDPDGLVAEHREARLPYSAYSLALGKGHIYVSSANQGIWSYSLADPTSPREIARVTERPGGSLSLQGDYLLCANCQALRSFDVSDPARPHIVGATPTLDCSTGFSGAFAAGSGYAYRAIGYSIPSRSSYLTVYDVRDPRALSEAGKGEGEIPLAPHCAAVAGEWLLLGGNDGVRAYAAPAIGAIDPAAHYVTAGSASHIVVGEQTEGSRLVYVAEGDGGVVVLRLVGSARPTVIPSPSAEPVSTRRPTSAPTPTRDLQRMHSAYLPIATIAGEWPLRELSIEFVGQFDGPCWDLDVKDAVIYRGQGPHVEVLDASDPGAIRGIGRSEPLAGLVFGVDVVDDYAYVAAGEAGLYVLGVGDPAEPLVVSRVRTGDAARGVVAERGYAYVAAADVGVVVVDITDPSVPRIVGSVEIEDRARSLAYADGYVYVTAARPEVSVKVIDVRDPQSPVEVAQLIQGDSYGLTEAVAVASGYAYVTDYGDGLAIYDVADPSSPVLVKWDPDARIYGPDIDIEGNVMYGSHGGIVDLSDPINPVAVAQVDLEYGGPAVAVSDGRAYYATALDGNIFDDSFAFMGSSGPLVVADVSNLPPPEVIGAYSRLRLDWFVPHGNWLYTRGSEGWLLYDAAASGMPVTVGAVPGLDDLSLLTVSGDTGYAVGEADDDSLYVLDFTQPAAPRRLGATAVAPRMSGFQFVGGRLYAVSQVRAPNRYGTPVTATLHVIDLHSPRTPRERGRFVVETQTGYCGLAVSGGTAFLGLDQEAELVLVDVRDADAPVEMSRLELGGRRRPCPVVARDSYAYFSVWEEGLHVVDATEPYRPRLANTLAEGIFGWDLALSGDHLYLSDPGLKVFDLSDPVRPQRVGHFAAPEYLPVDEYLLSALQVSGDRIYGIHEVLLTRGLSVLQIQERY